MESKECIRSPPSLAHRGRAIREQEFLGTDQELRQILFHNHRIIYTVQGDLVRVVHVRRGSQANIEGDDLET